METQHTTPFPGRIPGNLKNLWKVGGRWAWVFSWLCPWRLGGGPGFSPHVRQWLGGRPGWCPLVGRQPGCCLLVGWKSGGPCLKAWQRRNGLEGWGRQFRRGLSDRCLRRIRGLGNRCSCLECRGRSSPGGRDRSTLTHSDGAGSCGCSGGSDGSLGRSGVADRSGGSDGCSTYCSGLETPGKTETAPMVEYGIMYVTWSKSVCSSSSSMFY